MMPPIWERIIIWWCSKVGHSFNKEKEWEYSGHKHNTCLRCKHVISTKL